MRTNEPLHRHPVVRTDELVGAREAVTRVYTPHHLELLGPTPRLDVRLSAVSLGGVTAGVLRYGVDVEVVNDEPLNSYYVNVPLAGTAISWSGTDRVVSSPSRAAVFLPDLPGGIKWAGDCAQLCVKFTREALELELEGLLGRPMAKPIRFAMSMDLTTATSQGWLAILAFFKRECARPVGIAQQPIAARHLEHLLLHGFLLAQPHSYSDSLNDPHPSVQPRAIREAVDVMESHPEQPFTATDLARRAGVSVRALQDGFKHHVGMPPMTYLREVRLTRVHAELSAPGPGPVTVAEVALRWGFVHLGRFGVSYRRKFGVPPSQTIREARGTRRG